ncbi:MAG: YlzJ-like family protein [Bacillota bacterium]
MSDCAPSILWSVVPMELVTEGMQPPMPPRAELVVEGRVLQVVPEGDGSATLIRLISADPADYLDPRFQPGVRIRQAGGHLPSS